MRIWMSMTLLLIIGFSVHAQVSPIGPAHLALISELNRADPVNAGLLQNTGVRKLLLGQAAMPPEIAHRAISRLNRQGRLRLLICYLRIMPMWSGPGMRDLRRDFSDEEAYLNELVRREMTPFWRAYHRNEKVSPIFVRAERSTRTRSCPHGRPADRGPQFGKSLSVQEKNFLKGLLRADAFDNAQDRRARALVVIRGFRLLDRLDKAWTWVACESPEVRKEIGLECRRLLSQQKWADMGAYVEFMHRIGFSGDAWTSLQSNLPGVSRLADGYNLLYELLNAHATRADVGWMKAALPSIANPVRAGIVKDAIRRLERT